MDFPRNFLALSISSILLAACGGSSGGSSNSPVDNSGTPAPAPKVPLTSSEKQAVSQAFLTNLSDALPYVVEGAQQAISVTTSDINDYRALDDRDDQNSVVFHTTQFIERSGAALDTVRALLKRLKQGEEISPQEKFEFESYRYKGGVQYVIGSASNAVFSIEVEGNREGDTYKVIANIVFSGAARDDLQRGNFEQRYLINGRHEEAGIISTFTDVDIVSQHQVSALDKANDWDFGNFTADIDYQLALDVHEVEITNNGLITSAGIEFTAIAPSLPLSILHHQNGSLMAGQDRTSGTWISLVSALSRETGSSYYFPRRSEGLDSITQLSTDKFQILNLKQSQGENEERITTSELTLSGDNVSSYAASYGGGGRIPSVDGQDIELFTVTKVDTHTLRLNTGRNPVDLTLLEKKGGEAQQLKVHVDPLKAFDPIETAEINMQLRIDNQNIYAQNLMFSLPIDRNFQSFDEFIADENIQLEFYRYGGLAFNDFEFLKDGLNDDGRVVFEDASASNENIRTVNVGLDALHAPWLFTLNRKGSFQLEGNQRADYQLTWAHKGFANYQGILDIDSDDFDFSIGLSLLQPTLTFEGRFDSNALPVDKDTAENIAYSAVIEIDYDQLSAASLNPYLVEKESKQQDKPIQITTIGSIKIEGETIADVELLQGNFTLTEVNKLYPYLNDITCNQLTPSAGCQGIIGSHSRQHLFALRLNYKEGYSAPNIAALKDVEDLAFHNTCTIENVSVADCVDEDGGEVIRNGSGIITQVLDASVLLGLSEDYPQNVKGLPAVYTPSVDK